MKFRYIASIIVFSAIVIISGCSKKDNNQTKILCVGRYEDIVAIDGEKALFIQRKAVTDTNVLPRYIAYPVWC